MQEPRITTSKDRKKEEIMQVSESALEHGTRTCIAHLFLLAVGQHPYKEWLTSSGDVEERDEYVSILSS